MNCGIDRQPTVRIWRTRVVVLPRRIAAIVVGLFFIIKQLLLFLS
jgi:predicted secreted protein